MRSIRTVVSTFVVSTFVVAASLAAAGPAFAGSKINPLIATPPAVEPGAEVTFSGSCEFPTAAVELTFVINVNEDSTQPVNLVFAPSDPAAGTFIYVYPVPLEAVDQEVRVSGTCITDDGVVVRLLFGTFLIASTPTTTVAATTTTAPTTTTVAPTTTTALIAPSTLPATGASDPSGSVLVAGVLVALTGGALVLLARRWVART